MKNYRIFSYLFVAILCLGFVSCSDDDDPVFDAKDIVGTWTVTRVEGYYYEDGEKIDASETFTDGEWGFFFNEDGTGYEYGEDADEDFEWELKNGNQLILDYGFIKQTHNLAQLNSSSCVIDNRGKDEGEDKEYHIKTILKRYNMPN